MIYAFAKLLLFVRFHDMTSSRKGVTAKGYGIHGMKVELTMDPACEEQKELATSGSLRMENEGERKVMKQSWFHADGKLQVTAEVESTEVRSTRKVQGTRKDVKMSIVWPGELESRADELTKTPRPVLGFSWQPSSPMIDKAGEPRCGM